MPKNQVNNLLVLQRMNGADIMPPFLYILTAHRLNLAGTGFIKNQTRIWSNLGKSSILFTSYLWVVLVLGYLDLKSIQKIQNEPELTIKEPHGIRWLGLQNAEVAVYEGYGSVLATLSCFAAEKLKLQDS